MYKTVADKLSDFSYTLYLVHLPLLVFCQAWFIHNQRWQPSMMYLTLGIIILAGTILYAFLISSVTEAKTEYMRKWVTSWLVKKLN
jgi:peptidoglycan/LPS O-acetylase OafA/YrhL